ncbi:uncharacterized protein RJT20DRAFT_135439 [Scheffersomyces xylosifermentans]|uniref:uncharacterized protein n=1 Tax=Scheffersomyces xylosifermentans TaxID=1304137 RepID=UPI00315DF922
MTFSLSPQLVELINEQIQSEINTITRDYKAKIDHLTEENKALKRKIDKLTGTSSPLRLNTPKLGYSNGKLTLESSKVKLDPPTFTSEKSKISLKSFTEPAPKAKDHSIGVNLRSQSLYIAPTQYSDDEVQSSPIKISPKKIKESNRSQEDSYPVQESSSIPYFKLATQYSDTSSSPTKTQRAEEEIVEIVEDSEEEQPQLNAEVVLLYDSYKIEFPNRSRPFTKLQRMEYLTTFYKTIYQSDTSFKIKLSQNPVNEMDWYSADFKLNPDFRGKSEARVTYIKTINGTFKRRVGITKQEEENRRTFYRMAQGNQPDQKSLQYQDSNVGREAEVDDYSNDENDEDLDSADEYDDKLSQLFDKVPSPPGFMMSEFPDTQEQKRRRLIVEKRQKRRIRRRLKGCLTVRDGLQVGEYVFALDIFNQYVMQGRWYL